MEQQLELSLPYEDFTGRIGSQAYAKLNYQRGNDVMVFKIPFKDILIWEGYNARTIFENIEDLADSIHKHGQKTPFQLVLVKDGNRAFLKKGGRRHRAYQLLIEQGLFDPETMVPFELTSTKETMQEMILDLHVSNQYPEPLKPIDLATVAWRLKHLCGPEKSNEEVSELLGAKKVSRQTVDNLLLIYNAPDDIKNQIRVGDMNMTNAVSFVRAQRKQSKEADRKEKESHETKATVNNEPEDALEKEMQELADLEERTDEFKEREAAKAARDLEKLLDIANEVLVTKESLVPHIGKRFAAPAYGEWTEQVLDEGSGELVPKINHQLLLAKDQEVNDAAIEMLIANNAKSVFIYKAHTAAPSVFTELPETNEKSKFDLDRVEMAQVTNCIRLADKLEAIVNKIDVNEGTKKDVSDIVKWLQKDLDEVRTWIHNNRKFNKVR